MKRIGRAALRQPRLAQRALYSLAMTGLLAATARAQSPYATTLIAENGAFGGASLYNDPYAVLGEPTRVALNNDPIIGSTPFHVKIVEPAYNRDTSGNKVITTLARRNDGGSFTYGSITVKFDAPVYDDPANPYGIDLNVFGNAFYVGGGTTGGYVSDATDMRSYYLAGGVFAEPVVISVSPDNENWYTYADGPYGDTAFPTQGTLWDAEAHDNDGNGWTGVPTDFTKPVNPTLDDVLGVPGSIVYAADAMTMYVNSGGGTGIDLAPSGFDWIQYVRVEATAQFRDGEIDAFADVRPMRLGEALSITPANVDAGTRLFFQHPDDVGQSAVIADFSTVADLAKLSTGVVADEAALAALVNQSVLASFQLDVSPLVGAGSVAYAADFELLPGLSYAGAGENLQLLHWNDDAWKPIEFAFDADVNRIILEDWSEESTTLAIVAVPSPLEGDYDDNGVVDGGDFLAWQRLFGGVGPLPNETSSPGVVDHADLDVWKANFGAHSAVVNATAVPEPATIALATLLGLVVFRLKSGFDS